VDVECAGGDDGGGVVVVDVLADVVVDAASFGAAVVGDVGAAAPVVDGESLAVGPDPLGSGVVVVLGVAADSSTVVVVSWPIGSSGGGATSVA
jgi:hypothetical protein